MSIPDSIFNHVRDFQDWAAPVKRERLRTTLVRRTKIARRLGIDQSELPARFFESRRRRQYISLPNEYAWRRAGLIYPGDQLSLPNHRWRVDSYEDHDGTGWVIVETRRNVDGTISIRRRAAGPQAQDQTHDWLTVETPELEAPEPR